MRPFVRWTGRGGEMLAFSVDRSARHRLLNLAPIDTLAL
jgi:hypothetical protein